MLLKKLFLYFLCLIVAVLLLSVVLPHVGVDQAHFLPPTWAYRQAQGQASGVVTKTYSVQTNDPFHIGDRIYFWDYSFYAKTIPAGQTKPVLQQYNGEVRVLQASFDKIHEGDGVLVRYATTYPWINGLDTPQIGLGCGEGSNVLSGWLLWVGAAAVLAFVLLGIVNYFLPKEDL